MSMPLAAVDSGTRTGCRKVAVVLLLLAHVTHGTSAEQSGRTLMVSISLSVRFHDMMAI